MNTYKVITLSVGGRNNKVFSLGDKVTDKHFAEGAPAKLVAGGYLELVSTDDEPFQTPSEGGVEITQTEAETEEESSSEEVAETEAETEEESEVDKTTRNEIMDELKKMGVKFPSGASKAELYKLYEESKTKE
jgi:hypothetical protein